MSQILARWVLVLDVTRAVKRRKSFIQNVETTESFIQNRLYIMLLHFKSHLRIHNRLHSHRTWNAKGKICCENWSAKCP